MPFTANSLTNIAMGSARPTGTTPDFRRKLHFYVTDDAHATVSAAGYFLPAGSRLGIGDVIMVVTAANTTPVLRMYIISTLTAVACTVTQLNNT